MDCGQNCYSGSNEGETIRFTAIPDPGQVFLGWSDCEPEPSGTSCTAVAWGILCVEAYFTGPGSSVRAPECGGTGGGGAGSAPNAPPAAGAPPSDHPPVGSTCAIVGSPGRDVINGTPNMDVICGGGGDDVIYGRGGHDLILGGRGNDRIYGGPGREHLVGGLGNDLLNGGPADDELFGDAGADTLVARDKTADLVVGGTGRDRAQVDAADVLRGVERRF